MHIRKNYLTFILLILTLGVSASYCSENSTDNDQNPVDPANLIGPEGGTVVSTDGLLELIIPENALSGKNDIAITKIDHEEESEKVDISLDASYDLSPDGLSFSEPVEVNYSLSNPGISDSVFVVPFLINATENSIESLQNVTLSFDQQNDVLNVTGYLDHFSVLSIKKNDWKLWIDYPDEICIGDEEDLNINGRIDGFATWYDMNVDVYQGENLVLRHDPKNNNTFNIDIPFQCNAENQVPELNLSVEINVNYDPPSDIFMTLFSVYEIVKLPDLSTAIECVECIKEPNLLSPENNSENVELTPTLRWEEVENADWYEVQWIREGESFDDENVNRAFTTDQQRTLDKLDEETEYQWRVRACDGPEFDEDESNSGEWSDVWSFTTRKSTETLELGELKVCVEHGDTKSNIFFEWAIISNFFDNLSDVKVKLIVTLPDGTKADITTSPLSAKILLFTLEIYTYGNYEYEITEVTFKGDPIDISGEALTGEVNVSSEEQNAGECGE